MNIIESNSIFSIKKSFTLSDSDYKVLTFLYLPVIGEVSYALYISLYNLSSFSSEENYFFHEDILNIASMDEMTFLKARERLEGIGLLETYKKVSADKTYYTYLLIPNASPKKFFNDIVLNSILIKHLGEKKYIQVKKQFLINDFIPGDEQTNLTKSFASVYSLDEVKITDDGSVQLEDKKYKQQEKADFEAICAILENAKYDCTILDNYKKEIVDALTLYNCDNKVAADLIIQATDSNNIFYIKMFISSLRLVNNYGEIKKETTDEEKNYSEKENKFLNALSTMTPIEFLTIKFNAKPSSFMFDEVEKLKESFGFSNGVINVILDYSTKMTNGSFNETYIEKVALSLSSNNINSPYDAMVFLNKQDSIKAKKTKKPVFKKKKEEEIEDEDLVDLESLKI